MKSDLNKEGYDKEEEYFHKHNQELIEKMKEKERDANDDQKKPEGESHCP